MKVALIGEGISLSKTPAMHEAEGRAQGFPYAYHLIDTANAPYKDVPLSELLSNAERDGYSGVNITHPFKQRILDFVSWQSETVQQIGAANTVVFEAGERKAYNTDYAGFKRAFEKNMCGAATGHVLQLGAGGAGSAVALALINSGVGTLSIADTSPRMAQALVARYKKVRPDCQLQVHEFSTDYDLDDFDGVVNTTPVGMASHPGTAIPLHNLQPGQWVTDIVYFPLQTELLKYAQSIGCRSMSGGAMAVYQAVEAFELFSAKVAVAERFEQSFETHVIQ